MTAAIDRDALTRAMVACRAQGAARVQQLLDKLMSEPWEEVARFAAYSAQNRSLGLTPWQDPPSIVSLFDLNAPYGEARAGRENAEIKKKLLDLGLSIFEPDPMRAIAEAEAKRATS